METPCILCSISIVTSEFDLKPMCMECAEHYYNSVIKLPQEDNINE